MRQQMGHQVRLIGAYSAMCDQECDAGAGQIGQAGPVDRSMHGVESEGSIMHGVQSEGNIMHGVQSIRGKHHAWIPFRGQQHDATSDVLISTQVRCMSGWYQGNAIGTTTGDREDDDSLMHLTRSNTN